jgi:hypothetical protein
MIYVTYTFGGLFLFLCAGMLFVYFREKHIGLFLMGVAYGTAGLLAINMGEWWPLVVGFVLVWMLRFLGLEPAARAAAQSPDTKEGNS